MPTELTQTQRRIHESAIRHFLKHGFKSASLRKIVADAGFTLGAIYGYYSSKEELFCALVGDTANGLLEILREIAGDMDAFPPNQRIYHMTEAYLKKLPRLVDYLTAHKDEVRLLVACSSGTRYENFLNQILSSNMSRSVANMESSGLPAHPMRPTTFRMLMNAYFSMLTEIVLGDADREELIAVMSDIQKVYQYGIMNLITQQETGGAHEIPH